MSVWNDCPAPCVYAMPFLKSTCNRYSTRVPKAQCLWLFAVITRPQCLWGYLMYLQLINLTTRRAPCQNHVLCGVEWGVCAVRSGFILTWLDSTEHHWNNGNVNHEFFEFSRGEILNHFQPVRLMLCDSFVLTGRSCRTVLPPLQECSWRARLGALSDSVHRPTLSEISRV